MKNIFLENLKVYMGKHNMLWSVERQTIAEKVSASNNHFTADNLYIDLKQSGKDISRATVYRTLEILEKSGLVSKIQLKSGKHLYENIIGYSHHDHMICEKCGKIIEFYSEEIEKIQKKICTDNNFKMTGHTMRICGICSECQKDEERK
ncbi:MAG: transcriptional repressor [Candidatus Cloacimonadota bacterium]|nr:transcriptional repressor [Candidatus Cloacimonadota bacterium]